MALPELPGPERGRGFGLPPVRSVMAKAAPQEPALFGEDELLPAATPLVQQAYDLWNEFARRNKWKVAEVLDSGRRAALRRAVKDYGGLVGLRASLEKITRSDFCMGRIAPKEGRKQFKAHIDWFIQTATVRKVIENFYNDAEPVPTSILRQSSPEDEWGRFLRDYRIGGFWPSGRGARPEQPDCRAPAAMLEACRKRLGITVAVRAPDSREDRLAAMIVSYRGVGRYDDANRIELQLAAAQGRPPVEVPAPDAAAMGMPAKPAVAPRQPTVSDVYDEYELEPIGDEFEEA